MTASPVSLSALSGGGAEYVALRITLLAEEEKEQGAAFFSQS